ncbi:uncharacterized protein LOC117830239 [Notolabrus celidotus]|uniref:uncharacterized protein LOC117830239 n=1 Tax=Notolabrus celidotus TaxID=1203425 RepID=UPI00149007C2|nr:uncharacterized protein LOC117830239 [Notolabrus celidotus]
MRGGIQLLLLLAVFVLQARCQQGLKVSVYPILPVNQAFSGDSFHLSCNGSASENGVQWYLNDMQQRTTSKTYKIAAATQRHSGLYHCESNGEKSDSVNINVLDYIPTASLTIVTGQPVMQVGGSVILSLHNEDGLEGWKCWFYRGGGTKTKKIGLRVKENNLRLDFQPARLTAPETIFWCSDGTEQNRSNQITIRTSEKKLSLEMYPLPALVGERLTLRCLVWGTDQISHTVFYKDNKTIQGGASPTYNIPSVTESLGGSYKCESTFTYRGRTAGPPYKEESDDQDVLVQVPPIRAYLSENLGMSCSCPSCPSKNSYRWYHKSDEDQPWVPLGSDKGYLMPKESGTYACRAVWRNGRSLLSNGYAYQSPIKLIFLVVVMVLLIGLAVTAFACYMWYKKRTPKAPIYEDVAQASRNKGNNEYEMLQKSRREGEYDTLHPEAPGTQRKDGEYEALRKAEIQEGVYHTVEKHGAVGEERGYEVLKREGVKEDVYHTVEMHGAVGGEGGYEALKKEGRKEEVYHTLSMEGAGGGEEGIKHQGQAADRAYEVTEEKKD